MLTLLHIPPQAAGEVAPDDDFNGEGLGGPGHGDVGVRDVQDVVFDEVARLLEPEPGQPVEHLPFEGDGGEYLVEGREAVGGDEKEPVTLPVDVADFSPIAGAESVELRLREGEVELGAKGRVGHDAPLLPRAAPGGGPAERRRAA